MAIDNNVNIVINGEDKSKSAIRSAQGNLEGFGGVAKKVGLLLGGAFAVNKLVEFSKQSVQATIEAERSTRQLEHAVIDISKGTKEQVAQIDALSKALQKKAGIDGDALKAGTAQLSTFGLQSKSVVALTKSLADFTVNQNGVNASSDAYIQSANTIAKALNGQFGILEKSGVRFTDQQQKLILYGTEAEKVSALQEGLNQNLRETTDTIGNSYEGALARLSQSFGEIKEAIGAPLLELLAKVAGAVTPMVQSFADLIGSLNFSGIKNQLGEFLQTIDQNTGLVTLLLSAWNSFIDVVNNSLIPNLKTLWDSLDFFKPVLKEIAGWLGTSLVIAIGVLLTSIGSLVIGLTQLISWMTLGFSSASNGFKLYLDKLSDWLVPVINLVDKLANAFVRVIELAGQVSSKIAKTVTSGISKISGARASGGPVMGGSSYLVGELGPEVFTPSSSGRITANSALAGAGTINITITGNSLLSETAGELIVKQLTKALKQDLRI